MSQRDRNHNNKANKSHSSAHDRKHTTHESHRNRNERLNDGEARQTGQMHTDFRVMRCFCGCSTLTFEQIEHFAMMNVSSLVVHPEGKPLFRNFLRIGHLNDKSEAMMFLECFEMCEKILGNLYLTQDENQLDELYALCQSFTWEERIMDAISKDKQNHNHTDVIRVLNDLKRNCVHNIHCHRDFERFRRELLQKINK